MENFNLNTIIDSINLFLKEKNIQSDNLIIVCLLIFLISEKNSDFILIIILLLLIF